MKKSGRSGGKSISAGKMFRSASKRARSAGKSMFGGRSKGKTGRISGGSKGYSAGKSSRPLPGGTKKPDARGGYKSRDDFVKPPHDPGPKSIEEIAEDIDQTGSWTEESESGQGGGGGCCASISSMNPDRDRRDSRGGHHRSQVHQLHLIIL